MIIDAHAHYFPVDYLKALAKADVEGIFALKGFVFGYTDKMHDITLRFAELDSGHVDIQVLSLGPPGVDFLGLEDGLREARSFNEELSHICEKYPDKFVGLGTLPLKKPDEAVDELERAVRSLGLKGAMIFSNAAGRGVDEKVFWPLYEKASSLGVPLYVHPTTPVMQDLISDYGMALVIGWFFDTTVAIARMIFGGVLERYPTLKLIFPHLGGTFPYILGRVDKESEKVDEVFCKQPIARVNIKKEPSEYFKQIYLDTIAYRNIPALQCAFQTVGPSRLILGSDYPYFDITQGLENANSLPLSEDDRKNVLGGTAAKLFNIK